jgi:DNA (cytosine-5)-methyltransferase 1
MSITVTDMFCGAGGSTEGARQAGAIPILGMNHWKVACDSYEANHASHGARAACVDVVTQDPRRYPKTDLLIASPECTSHSWAVGRPKDDPSLFDPKGDKSAERSRATMWDIPRFAEAHHYHAIIVENVAAAVKWGVPKGKKIPSTKMGPLFDAWIYTMKALDYEHEIVHLNSLVCGVPQSRDRLYVVFWKKGQRKPDLNIPVRGWCPTCENIVWAERVWKNEAAVYGMFEQGYFYACQTCRAKVTVAVRPAASVIDFDNPGPVIGDRLTEATRDRIRRGLKKLTSQPRAYLQMPEGLVVQVGAHTFERPGYTRAWSTDEPLKTIHGTLDRGLVLSNMNHNVPRASAVEPMHAVTTGGKLGLVTPAGGPSAEAVDIMGPMGTLTTRDRFGVVINQYGSPTGPESKMGWARHAEVASLGTVTARDSHALFTYRRGNDIQPLQDAINAVTTRETHALIGADGAISDADLERCTFRMLKPDELKGGSGFPSDYLLHGTKGDQVRQVGNAVTPPVEEELVRRVIASLDEA